MNGLKITPIESPCKECTQRHTKCHSESKEYRKYKFVVQAVKQKNVAKKEQIDFERDITAKLRRTHQKLKKWGSYV